MKLFQVAEHLRLVFSDLDKSNTDVLRYFIGHLHKVASSPSTAMDIKNLSKVFFPTFFRPNFTDFAAMSTGTILYQRAMEAVIQHSVHIFSSTVWPLFFSVRKPWCYSISPLPSGCEYTCCLYVNPVHIEYSILTIKIYQSCRLEVSLFLLFSVSLLVFNNIICLGLPKTLRN